MSNGTDLDLDFYRGLNVLGHPTRIALTGQEPGAPGSLAAGAVPVGPRPGDAPIGTGAPGGPGGAPGQSSTLRALAQALGLSERVLKGLTGGPGAPGRDEAAFQTQRAGERMPPAMSAAGMTPAEFQSVADVLGHPSAWESLNLTPADLANLRALMAEGTLGDRLAALQAEQTVGATSAEEAAALGGTAEGWPGQFSAAGSAIPLAQAGVNIAERAGTKMPAGQQATYGVLDVAGAALAGPSLGFSIPTAMAIESMLAPLWDSPYREARGRAGSDIITRIPEFVNRLRLSMTPEELDAALRSYQGQRTAFDPAALGFTGGYEVGERAFPQINPVIQRLVAVERALMADPSPQAQAQLAALRESAMQDIATSGLGHYGYVDPVVGPIYEAEQRRQQENALSGQGGD